MSLYFEENLESFVKYLLLRSEAFLKLSYDIFILNLEEFMPRSWTNKISRCLEESFDEVRCVSRGSNGLGSERRWLTGCVIEI